MGKSKKAQQEVSDYHLSLHMGLCHGPVVLKGLRIDGKTIWSGTADSASALTINKRELFGGAKKEGGVAGTAHWLPGEWDQVLPDALAQKLGRANGADCPGFRGLASLFFTDGGNGQKGFYWTSNTPYLKGVEAIVQDLSTDWYPEKVEIPNEQEENAFTGWYAKARVDLINPTTSPGGSVRPNNSTWIFFDDTDVWPGTSNDEYPGGIPYVDADEDGFGFTFYWCDPAIMDVSEVSLVMQMIGSVGDSMRASFAWQFWNDGPAPTIAPLATSVVNNPGDASHSLGDPFDVRSLWPDVWYFDPTGEHDIIVPSGNMNPAHMIRLCLTNGEWGMGEPDSLIDDTSFTSAADTLYDERLGLTMIWTKQSDIESFVTEIIDHIQATLFLNPRTGLWTLKLLRADYDPDTLPVLTPDNCSLANFQRKAWGEITSEIVVTWTNPENEQEETVSLQDPGAIAIQGTPISSSRNYYGIRSASKAMELAARDLRAAAAPLASCDAEQDRGAWDLLPGDVVKLNWPEHGLSGIVFRVGPVNYGKPGDSKVKAPLVEDIFGLGAGDYVAPPSSGWVDPSQPPEPMTWSRIITLPAFLAAAVDTDTESLEYPEVLAGFLASSDSDDIVSYDMLGPTVLPGGSTVQEVQFTGTILGRAELITSLEAEAETTGVEFSDLAGSVAPGISVFVLIGDDETAEEDMEIALITAEADAVCTLSRGVLDTVPLPWASGTAVWLLTSGSNISDLDIHADGEDLSVKLLTRTSLGLLDPDEAPALEGTLTGRPHYPNRPANVTLNGVGFTTADYPIDIADEAGPTIPAAWANRNRLLEDSQVVAWGDETMTPEDGQTTTIEVIDPDGNTVATHDALEGTSFDLPISDFGSDGIYRVRFTSERDELASLTGHELHVRAFGSRVTETADIRLTEGGDYRSTED